MVASSANISRPLAPTPCGDIARALATNAAISSDADGVASGNVPDLPATACFSEDRWLEDFGFTGSPDINARKSAASLYMGRAPRAVNARGIRQFREASISPRRQL